jgi:lipopolysaccharide heptosyltransferase I
MLPASRILIIRPSALGDVARSVCVLASLRAAYPHAQIDWLVRDAFAPVIASHPALSSVVMFPRNDFARWTRTLRLDKLHAFGRSLRDRQYDVVLDCQGLARSGWMAWASGAKVRVGNRFARELSWLCMTHRVRVPSGLHSVESMLALLEPLGVPALRDARAMSLYTSASDQAWLRTQPFAHRPYVVLAPTSAWETKEWPADRFANVADALSKRGATDGLPVVVVGAKHERERIAPLLTLCNRNPLVLDRVGSTSVGQLMAILERSALVVANDSASLHIAVGFRRPVVALLGPTDPKLVGPYQRDADVLQHIEQGEVLAYRKEKTRRMIERIHTSEVLDACFERLATQTK